MSSPFYPATILHIVAQYGNSICPSVCLSVCLSVTLTHYDEKAKHVVNLYSPVYLFIQFISPQLEKVKTINTK